MDSLLRSPSSASFRLVSLPASLKMLHAAPLPAPNRRNTLRRSPSSRSISCSEKSSTSTSDLARVPYAQPSSSEPGDRTGTGFLRRLRTHFRPRGRHLSALQVPIQPIQPPAQHDLPTPAASPSSSARSLSPYNTLAPPCQTAPLTPPATPSDRLSPLQEESTPAIEPSLCDTSLPLDPTQIPLPPSPRHIPVDLPHSLTTIKSDSGYLSGSRSDGELQHIITHPEDSSSCVADELAEQRDTILEKPKPCFRSLSSFVESGLFTDDVDPTGPCPEDEDELESPISPLRPQRPRLLSHFSDVNVPVRRNRSMSIFGKRSTQIAPGTAGQAFNLVSNARRQSLSFPVSTR
ncbi:hypothetical protein BOTBODRAFT_39149 [Botryobasidium botryosum FD-172 SS1]|uniref:Uncharacterized protein n=1 Tax=Botryobasidium botryosum (strain FD-172 SS1) TaxID=930990 RepID=A0A067M603_BOTB1|nr:hypothetical protein BOTBODRAFT_39149 [Botryobasidium botryosum FD-172 SS1]